MRCIDILLYIVAGGFLTSIIFGIKVAERSQSGYTKGWLHGQSEATSMAMGDLILLAALALGVPYLMEDYTGFSRNLVIVGWFIFNWLVIWGAIKQRS